MGQTPIAFKQGTSFGASCVYTPETGGPTDLTGVTIASAVRDAGWNYYPLVVTKTSPTTFTLLYPFSTLNWVLGTGYFDIQFSYGEGDSSIFYTQSIQLQVQPSITGVYAGNTMIYG
jgi:hypothetical protein